MIDKINSISEFITSIKYKNHDEEYRKLFIKYYYVGILFQCRYFFRDYISNRKYKIIKYDGEFGPELKYVVPFAYWHYLNGTLNKTISSKYTRELYYFSDYHEELFEKRRYRQYMYGIPNSEDHNLIYNYFQWIPVPYRKVYTNDIIKFDKPILIVANKYNIEWDEAPVNYLSEDLLIWIMDNYADKYQIIYNRPGDNIIAGDNSEVLNFNDHRIIKHNYKNVINITELYREMKTGQINNFNHFQLMVYANADKFVSVHGGASVLASYFGGTNLIYSVKGFEHYFNEFQSFYPKLSGAKILLAKSNNDVKSFMKNYY